MVDSLVSILMMYANAGNIDAYIAARCSSGGPLKDQGDLDRPMTSEERKKLFKRRLAGNKKGETLPGRSPTASNGDIRGIMLLGREEIESLFGDIVEGLAYLVSCLPVSLPRAPVQC